MSEKPTEIKTAQDKAQGEIDAMRRALTAMMAAAPEIARLRKCMFDEHLAAGFSTDQALELCKKLTL